MVSKTTVIETDGARRTLLGLALTIALVLALLPTQALAYYNRGSVSVALGTTGVEVQAGATASVTVAITPASDDQTEGCGMPKCPQGCSDTCADENGQCRCSGPDYKTYYPTAVASSSNASVAVATYSGGALTVYGKSEGEATITVRASLRQFTDAEDTLKVTVSGTAAGAQAGSAAFVDVPETAAAVQEDKADIVDKTVMGRPVRNVRINDACDAAARLAEMAGIDGDVTFWEGDTYYHPNYSLTFNGTTYDASAVQPFDVNLAVSTEAEGVLNQPLSGVQGFVAVDFAQKGALPAPATVYAQAKTALSDDDSVALFSYDGGAKAFVREEAPAAMVGGYATFTVQEGKTYVVSSRDLTTEAKDIVVGGAASAQQGGSCCDPTPAAAAMADGASCCDASSAAMAPVVPIAIGAIVVAAAAAAIVIIMTQRKGKSAGAPPKPLTKSENKGNEEE
ncbi:hypothetical protein [Gordonibacter urolithinfaciens]|uniref:Uncharacterized protein n=1 Tax=Gordonibacter urolithinfaciens TaxID=1335613 RepID=A0A6N8IF33_9ACTN|nr:hypothetical protein [Gordonibacter urolithinfaciens]MVM54268.1 hypothetical protein [Gordonibacter urolithinfaciens]MVN14524.1 hypothetical protein [Gordonibacter urolithinfaciens]MVN37685.1 hypothetical protein [Gordonibacter urolithinfaciens]MVN56319.1 hypothetical protein [Gordonibacter urolithinfaciens]MVN62415.1 hypothetical protein [Gordonibacter urolithinfaciens]